VWFSVTAGVYLALSRDVLRCVLGLACSAAAPTWCCSPRAGSAPSRRRWCRSVRSCCARPANPLPQALVLTAIVIGFALVCFSLVLVLRLIQRAGTDDAAALRHAEPVPTTRSSRRCRRCDPPGHRRRRAPDGGRSSPPVLVPLATALLTTLAGRRPAAAGAQLRRRRGLRAVRDRAGRAGRWPTRRRAAFGGWAAPFGIEFAVDRTGAALVLITALMGAASLLFLASDADPGPQHPLLLPLVHGLLAGVGGAFCTADLFNLYVWFEVMLICSLGLFAIGGRVDQLDASFKYLVLNLFGTLLLLMAVGAGVRRHRPPQLRRAGAAAPACRRCAGRCCWRLLLAFLIKAGAFPLFAWLPASYHTLPAPVLALFAGLLTKVGVYAVLRTLGDVFAPRRRCCYEALGWIAAATMLFGVLGAAYHWDIRRILAFHIVSQIGYILLGIALAGEAGNAATLFYTVHHIIVKANLFLIAAMSGGSPAATTCAASAACMRRKPAAGGAVPGAGAVAGRHPAAVGLLGQAHGAERDARPGALRLDRGRAAGQRADPVLDDEDLDGGVLEAAPGPTLALPARTRLGPGLGGTVGAGLVTLAIGLNPQPLVAYAQAAARAWPMTVALMNRLFAAIVLLLRFLRAVVVSGLQTVRVILSAPRPATAAAGAYLRVRFAPMSGRRGLLGCMVSLTPGTTTVIDIDMERRELLLHVLDAIGHRCGGRGHPARLRPLPARAVREGGLT
jgi:multicomponent Na+:H+ antiporter subunit D